MKVISQLHKQWGIDCKPKDFTLAVARLLQIGVIDQPVDILHPEVWDKCTKALAEETMSSGCGKNLKSWGKVLQALQKAIQEQETWSAAKDCLWATPKLGVGAATQTAPPTDSPNDNNPAEHKDSQESGALPHSPNTDPLTVGQKQAKSFWGGLTKETRNAEEGAESEEVWAGPAPYAPQDSAEQKGEGRDEDARDGNGEEAPALTGAHKREGEENEKGKGGGGQREEEGSASEGRKPNQSGHQQKCPYKANTPPSRGRGEPRGRGQPALRGSGRGRSPTERYRKPEVAGQSSSEPGSDASGDEWPVTDSNSEDEEVRINTVKSRNIPVRNKKGPRGEEIPLTDWRKIKSACADWVPSATRAFPDRAMDGGQRVRSPINPKDIQAIVKAIADMIKHVAEEEHLALIQAAVHTAIANAMACFKCGQAGHVVANCPQLGDPPTAPTSRQNRPRGPCWACGKTGHFARTCRSKTKGNGKGRGHPGRAQPSPTWDVRRPHYANPRWGEALPNPLPPREATNFVAQPAVQSNLPLSQGQQGPPLGSETPRWPWQ